MAPATGPSSSAGSSVASHTPATAALCAAIAPAVDCPAVCFPVSSAASTVSARMLSQSPRLDRDSATHSRLNGLMDSTPDFSWALGDRRARCPAPSRFGGARKFTALAYRDYGPTGRSGPGS